MSPPDPTTVPYQPPTKGWRTFLLLWSSQSISVFGSELTFFALSIWQVQMPRELQGRVFAVRRLIAQFTSPLGVALAGIVGGQFDPGLVIAVAGGSLLVFSAVQLFNRDLLRVEDKVWLDALAAKRSNRGSGIRDQ